jgi:hypothetical protein
VCVLADLSLFVSSGGGLAWLQALGSWPQQAKVHALQVAVWSKLMLLHEG